MKQAKFALTSVVLLGIVGGALAFKANRTFKTFYKYTTSFLDGKITGICDQNQAVSLQLTTVAAGGVVTTVSSSPAINVTTCTARVNASL
jgi:hypothetical protein